VHLQEKDDLRQFVPNNLPRTSIYKSRMRTGDGGLRRRRPGLRHEGDTTVEPSQRHHAGSTTAPDTHADVGDPATMATDGTSSSTTSLIRPAGLTTEEVVARGKEATDDYIKVQVRRHDVRRWRLQLSEI